MIQFGEFCGMRDLVSKLVVHMYKMQRRTSERRGREWAARWMTWDTSNESYDLLLTKTRGSRDY